MVYGVLINIFSSPAHTDVFSSPAHTDIFSSPVHTDVFTESYASSFNASMNNTRNVEILLEETYCRFINK
jgi:hypothetical protein